MPSRPGWYDNYWKNLDKDTARRMRTTCPRCGSSETYYNKLYKTWRCGRCEHSFVIEWVDERPWWKRLLPFLK